MLREVLAGTPAAQAGLRPGDRIIELDGQPNPVRSRPDGPARSDFGTSNHHARHRSRRRLTRQRLSFSLLHGQPACRAIDSGPDCPHRHIVTTSAKRWATVPVANCQVKYLALVTTPAACEVRRSKQDGPAHLPSPQPDDLRLTLPRAVVERFEKLRPTEKLESLPPYHGPASASDPQISSARHP